MRNKQFLEFILLCFLSNQSLEGEVLKMYAFFSSSDNENVPTFVMVFLMYLAILYIIYSHLSLQDTKFHVPSRMDAVSALTYPIVPLG